jgi:hypothetical protein
VGEKSSVTMPFQVTRRFAGRQKSSDGAYRFGQGHGVRFVRRQSNGLVLEVPALVHPGDRTALVVAGRSRPYRAGGSAVSNGLIRWPDRGALSLVRRVGSAFLRGDILSP